MIYSLRSLLAGFSTIIILAGCGAQKSEKKPVGPAEIPVTSLEPVDTILSQYYVADIQAMRNVEVRCRVQGFLEQIYVDEGQEVKKGQLLFRINPGEFRIALQKAESGVASARAQARVAEVELERIRAMVEKRVIAASEAQLAEAKLNVARAEVDNMIAVRAEAEARLAYTAVHAPFDGLIDRIPMKTGSLVTDGSLLTTISDDHDMYAYFNVSENEFLKQGEKKSGSLSPNSMAALVLSNGLPYKYPGQIQMHEGEFNDNTGSIAFRAKFPNPDKTLKHGASGQVHLTTPLNQVILVPQKSVFEIQDKSYVFVVNKDSTLKMRAFQPQTRIAEYYVVQTGLQAGDLIVYEGVQNVSDGARISPRYTDREGLSARAH